jgi:hypothetical protein
MSQEFDDGYFSEPTTAAGREPPRAGLCVLSFLCSRSHYKACIRAEDSSSRIAGQPRSRARRLDRGWNRRVAQGAKHFELDSTWHLLLDNDTP